MTRTYKHGPLRRVGNSVVSAVLRLGIGPMKTYLLTTRGRQTGRPRTNPVMLVESGSQRWLVAPYGEVSWVHNARAAGSVTLTKGGRKAQYSIRELSPSEAAPVLRRYVRRAPVVLPYFEVKPSAPSAEFEKEAARHPVFELIPR